MTRRAAWLCLLLAATVLSSPRSAGAFEFFDGRLQIHGFGEAIIRTLNNNFEYDYDLSQMQFVLNLEAELDISPEGFGPFSAMSAYARVEVRYDCVWRKACYLAPNSVDHLGDRIRGLPNWRTDGRESQFTGTTFGDPTAAKYHGGIGSHRSREVTTVMDSIFKGAYESKGPDRILGTKDDPAPLILGKYGHYKISANKVRGPINGEGIAWELPWRPEDQLPEGPGLFRFKPNALSPLEPAQSCQVSDVQSVSCKLGWQKVSTLVSGSTVGFRGAGPGGTTFSPQGAGWPEPAGIPLGAQPRDIALNIEALQYYRPWPLTPVRDAGNLSKTEASGLYFPSAAFQKYLRTEDQSPFDQNFSQSQLSWNHGASQQDERELKEAYLDVEMADGALWLRIGKQNIVWAKTDVFRVADKINPQDVGLATLPSLEESRIALWAVRAVYSFYDVGPLQDVRLELAAIVDEFEAVDVGRCGEPYSPRPVFGKCLGIFAHSATGLGLAGETRPPNWWDSAKGMEFGGRLEWRWKRFSFALMDYYGFDDFPRVDVINKYSRNVDPYTGRPRWGMTTERCDPSHGVNKGCLGTVITSPYPAAEMAGFVPNGANSANTSSTWGRGGFAPPGDGPGRKSEVQNTRILEARKRASQDSNLRDILTNHPSNQSFFHFACAASIGFTDLAPTECGFSIFGSGNVLTTGFGGAFEEIPIVTGLALLLGGSSTLYDLAITFLNPAAAGKLNVVPLNHNDMAPGRCRANPDPLQVQNCKVGQYTTEWTPASRTGEGAYGLWGDQPFPFPAPSLLPQRSPGGALSFILQRLGTISTAFTPEQQALLGCGAYYASSCDRQGVDLLNAEASALFMSWPGFDGTPIANYRMDNKNQAAPGTTGFVGGPVCTRYERGKQFILPGCRGPEDPGYRRDVDGYPYFNELLNNTAGGLPVGAGLPASDLVNFDAFSTSNGCPSILGPDINPNPLLVNRRLKGDNIRLFNPINCQAFKSEMAAFSYNFLAIAILFSMDAGDDGFSSPEDFDEFNAEDPYNPNRCSLAAPQFCSVVRSLLSVTGVGRNTVKAGGSFSYGRRDFLWHGGQEVVLRYDRQNTLSFQMDFAEDWSKTNWGMEFTWIDSLPFTDANADSTFTNSDQYTLVVSVDRPTFINFLNANRTFLFNSQWFMSYRPDHGSGFHSNGPYNVTTTFTVLSGYFQDRLLAVFTLVYDFQSESGGGLPSVTYRFSESFSATFGMAFFWGRTQDFDPLSMPRALGNRVGQNAYRDHVETGLGVVRDRDEFFFRLRYTF
jgi:hypothetical protein